MDKILGVVRHLVSAAGAVLLTFGFTDSATVTSALTSFDGLIGSVLALAGIGASVYNSITHKNAVVAAASTAAVTGSAAAGVEAAKAQ